MKLSKAIKKEKIIMQKVSRLMCSIGAIYKKVKCPNYEELREATLDEIVEGAILWNPSFEGQQWHIVTNAENIDTSRYCTDPKDVQNGKMYEYDGCVYKCYEPNTRMYVEI